MKPTNVTGYPFSNGDRLTAISVNQICNALDAIQDYNDTIKEFEDLVEKNTEEIKSEINRVAYDDVSVNGITGEIGAGKAAIAAAINAKGGTASATESFSELADDVVNLNSSFITYGVEVTEKIHWLKFICDAGAVPRLPLTAIDDDVVTNVSTSNTFQNCSALENVKMTALITISGGYAFSGLSALQVVNMPNLTTISGANVFDGCIALQVVNMPNLVTLGGNYIFSNCSALQEVNMPNLVTLSSFVFQNCSVLQEVDLPNLINMGSYVLQNCSALRNMILGTLSTIGDPFYTAKPNLRNITIGANTNINLPFNQWTATNVINEGQSGIDELNTNIMTNLVPNLYLNGGKTLRLGTTLYDVLTTATKDAITDRGWTLQRG